jgi:type I site-specific restriction endonuclease
MATGAGKTYTAMYHILKHAKGKRILGSVAAKNHRVLRGQVAQDDLVKSTHDHHFYSY